MTTAHYSRQDIAALLKQGKGSITSDQRLRILDQLIDTYTHLKSEDDQLAHEIRRAFLLTLKNTPEILAEERILRFLAEHIRAEDFADYPWHSTDAIIAYCEMLYSFRFNDETTAEHVHVLVQHLMRYALNQYEQRGKYEQMFQLLHLTPSTPALTDTELQRLRNRTYLYEMRRTRRSRRWLYGYLLIQVVLITLVFPLLFVAAENGTLGRIVEQESEVDLPPEQNRTFSYGDGLYWAIITAASIGYGDVTPRTTIGKIMAAALGTMGVITIGVIAGLILDWISPRSID